MNATESLLALYRAARDFTRRAVSAETLERAALAHAEARGWLAGHQARSERENRLRERVATLEAVITEIVAADDEALGHGHTLGWSRLKIAVRRAQELVIR
jgi:hypothetical protein